MSDPIVELRRVSKRFGDVEVVRSLDLAVRKGEFLTLLGPSGCGKTTTLRMIGGFEQPTSGELYLNGQEVSHLPPYRRDVNTVFQSYALFPHLTVQANVAYGLEQKRVPRAEVAERVREALRMVRMEDFAARKPRELSGGQQQRIAVARAIVNSPSVLLLDEPLGALDLKLRRQMQVELKQLQQRLGMTFIYVTHDQEEALSLSDRIAVMERGAIAQIGTPEEIYNAPRTRFVADFIGETNLLGGVVRGEGGALALEVEGGRVPVRSTAEVEAGARLALSVRPERVRVSLPGEGGFLEATVEEVLFVGSIWKTVLRLRGGQRLVATEPPASHRSIRPGQAVVVGWDADAAVLLSE